MRSTPSRTGMLQQAVYWLNDPLPQSLGTVFVEHDIDSSARTVFLPFEKDDDAHRKAYFATLISTRKETCILYRGNFL